MNLLQNLDRQDARPTKVLFTLFYLHFNKPAFLIHQNSNTIPK
jgi:hypothetical protein